jgi:hypothetical protein
MTNEISYDTRYQYLKEHKLRKLEQLQEHGSVATWVREEYQFGLVSSIKDGIDQIEMDLLSWFVDNEMYREAAWLRNQLIDARKTFLKPKAKPNVIKEGLFHPAPPDPL